jgi:hypothetical protein
MPAEEAQEVKAGIDSQPAVSWAAAGSLLLDQRL